MTRIAFIHARFFDENVTERSLVLRFTTFLRQLRIRRQVVETGGTENAAIAEGFSAEFDPRTSIHVDEGDMKRIRARAERLMVQRKSASGLTHLRTEDRVRLRAFETGAVIGKIATEHRADEIAAAPHEKFPWMSEATGRVWNDLRELARSGQPGIRIRPLILDGAPGIGKSEWARTLAGLLGIPALMVDATTENASFGLVGSQRGWSNAHPGRLIDTIMATGAANQLVIIDEIEKAGDVRSGKGMSFSLEYALLPLLEPSTARSWTCPYYQVRFDMSFISWVMTTNDARRLSAPLLSRCPPIRVRDPTEEELCDLAQRLSSTLELSDSAIGAVVDAIGRTILTGRRVDVRDVLRMLDRAVVLQNRRLEH